MTPRSSRGAGLAQLRRLARLEAPVESETPFGGRTVSWEPAADLWVAMSPMRARDVAQGGVARTVAVARAEAREHPAAEAGMRLELDGMVWRVAAVDRAGAEPGRMILHIEKD